MTTYQTGLLLASPKGDLRDHCSPWTPPGPKPLEQILGSLCCQVWAHDAAMETGAGGRQAEFQLRVPSTLATQLCPTMPCVVPGLLPSS
jgi:hypothetical protein